MKTGLVDERRGEEGVPSEGERRGEGTTGLREMGRENERGRERERKKEGE